MARLVTKRCVVGFADTPHFRRGLDRIYRTFNAQGLSTQKCWTSLPPGCPTHHQSQYCFKSFTLDLAAKEGFETLLWCDSCIVPIRDVTPLWEHIESEGYWIARNGWTNDIWTADSAYTDLFPEFFTGQADKDNPWPCESILSPLEQARKCNSRIPHVVATTYGLSMRHSVGRELLAEMLRLGTTTTAFNGPSWNTNNAECIRPHTSRCGPCGPPQVRGHRQDQSALSVLAWRMGLTLVDSPRFFAYAGGQREDTCIVADGGYTLAL
jgi:hypothetical protein